MPSSRSQATRQLYLETFLISLAVLVLEVSYTRVFSYKLVYYFTYLVIGISLLGLGAGSVLVVVFRRLRETAEERLIATCCLIASTAVLAGYLVVAWMPLNLLQMVLGFAHGLLDQPALEVAKLAIVCLALFLPFAAAGIAIATIFTRHAERIHRLYFSDLAGAGLGCTIVVPAIGWITPPGCVFLSGFCFALAGARLARATSVRLARSTAAVALGLVAGMLVPSRLPDPVRDLAKGGRMYAVFSRWSPVFRVDVKDVIPGSPPIRFLVHDGTLGSSMLGYDGDPTSLSRYEKDSRSFPFRLLGPKPTVAIIGSAGGNEILASLHFDAEHVTGIELNPVTVSLLTTHFADFTGHLTSDPRVTLVNAEGRAFLESSDRRFDLVWLVAPDSYAAMNGATAGAFVLSESYLYTREMVLDALRHLNPDGILCAQFGELEFDDHPNRTVRYLGTVRQALAELGIDDPGGHVLVALTPGFERLRTATVLVRAKAFSGAQVEHFVAAASTVEGAEIVHAPDRPELSRPIHDVLALHRDDLGGFYRAYPYKVDPISDDSPFFWNFVRFRDVLRGGAGSAAMNVEEGVGERLLLVFLAVASAFAASFLFAPLLMIRGVWRTVPHKLTAAVYFGALGLGFMFIEVSLIQRLTLFLGYPTYSLTVTLFALLLSTGIGSVATEWYAEDRGRALVGLLALLALTIGAYELGLTDLVRRHVGWPLPLRVGTTIALLAPLGFCLGGFMPIGLRTVASLTVHREEFVAWCWAVNGFFSVIASVLATMLSMTLGFDTVLLLGLAVYAMAGFAFFRIARQSFSTA